MEHRVQHRRVQGLRPDALHEAAIDLDIVEGVFFQIDQRAVAGTEIVYRNLNIVLMQPGENLSGIFIAHHGAFGHFKHVAEMVIRHGGDPALNVLLKTLRRQMQRRKIQAHMGTGGNVGIEPVRIARHQLEQMTRQRNNQVQRLGVADKHIRRDKAFAWVVPAQQRFQPVGATAEGADQRLILDVKLAAFDAEQDLFVRTLVHRQQQPAAAAYQQRQQNAAQHDHLNIAHRYRIAIENKLQRIAVERQLHQRLRRQVALRDRNRLPAGERAVLRHQRHAGNFRMIRGQQLIGRQVKVDGGEHAGLHALRIAQPESEDRLAGL